MNFPSIPSISNDNSDDDDYDDNDNDDGADDAKEKEEVVHLCGREMDETGQMFSFGGGEIFLLLETALQLVHLSCCH